MMNAEQLFDSGMAAFADGDYPAASDLLQQALAQLRRAGRPKELGLCIYILESARTFVLEREFHKEPVEEALALFQQSGQHYLAASCCVILARVVVAEDPKEAKRLLDAARIHYSRCDNWTGPARVSRLEAKFALDRGDEGEARRLLDDALKLINAQPQGLESVKAEKRQIEALRSVI